MPLPLVLQNEPILRLLSPWLTALMICMRLEVEFDFKGLDPENVDLFPEILIPFQILLTFLLAWTNCGFCVYWQNTLSSTSLNQMSCIKLSSNSIISWLILSIGLNTWLSCCCSSFTVMTFSQVYNKMSMSLIFSTITLLLCCAFESSSSKCSLVNLYVFSHRIWMMSADMISTLKMISQMIHHIDSKAKISIWYFHVVYIPLIDPCFIDIDS